MCGTMSVTAVILPLPQEVSNCESSCPLYGFAPRTLWLIMCGSCTLDVGLPVQPRCPIVLWLSTKQRQHIPNFNGRNAHRAT